MKAQVFILQGRDDLYRTISSLLRDKIHRDIDVKSVEIDPRYSQTSQEEMHRRCRDYLRFLRASLVATNPFDIVVKNDWGTQWCYLGDSSGSDGFCFELKHMQMTALFPAVAIMDRIVMLPEEFYQLLDVHPRSFLSLARPLDLAGVELVDFHTREAIERAAQRVAVQLKREWGSLCHRYMGIHRLFKPDFDELGRLLNVDPTILEANCLYSPDVRLYAAIADGKAVEGVLSRVVLELRNDGGRPLRNIRIRVRAPARVMAAPVSQMLDLLPPKTVRLELELTPAAAPCCPLEVFVDHGDEPSLIPSFPIPVLVDVLPREAAA